MALSVYHLQGQGHIASFCAIWTELIDLCLSCDRTAMKRVAEAMNSLDAKRFKDKFGNNFNYTHSHTWEMAIEGER